MAKWKGIIKEFGRFMPFRKGTIPVTFYEGNTPLVEAKRLAREIGFEGKLYLKNEGANPTGSFKDRGMTTAITKAVQDGCEAVVCASTGNTSASAAAHAARAGIECFVILPHGNVAEGKLAQARMYGAKIVQIRGNFDDALLKVREISEEYGITIVNSTHPYRLHGQKTAAFEIWRESCAPDYHFMPVGNGGNISAYWAGYKEYARYLYGLPEKFDMPNTILPKMMGWQAEGAAPIVLGKIVEDPKTFATAIRIGNPTKWQEVIQAINESGGKMGAVSDEEIEEAYRLIPRLEGVYCEPASAASVAGLMKSVREDKDFVNSASKIAVCVLTGNGLKDPDSATRGAPKLTVLDNNVSQVAKFFKL